jgi:LPXTG-site transpeptidase (sortase) family protein
VTSLTLPIDRRTRLALIALVTLLLVLLIWWLVSQHGSDDAEARDVTGREQTAEDAGGDALVVPSIGLKAPIVSIAMHGNTLSPPNDTDIVGWWRLSAEPGAKRGQTVVTGHTIHTGGGVMGRLGNVERGDRVRIIDEGQKIAYRATKVFVYSKAELSENAQALFGQQRTDGRLVLVSCTDWDGVDYLSNIIVFAKQAREPA